MFNSRGSFLSSIPPVTKNIIIINVLVWVAEIVFPRSLGINLTTLLGLHYWGASNFNPVQIITYMFLHDDGSIAHLFFNMFSLVMFGPLLERVLNSKRFLFYYMSCGIGAALVQEITWALTWKDMLADLIVSTQGAPYQAAIDAIDMALVKGEAIPFLNNLVTIGASGAVFGILLAFGMIFPNMPLYIMFLPIPIKAKWMVLGYGAIELIFGVTNSMTSVAHFAHLGGMLFGFIIIYIWKKKGLFNGGTFI